MSAQLDQHQAACVQRRFEQLVFDLVRARSFELINMMPIQGARDDVAVRMVVGDVCNELILSLSIVQRGHKHLGVLDAGRFQE